jgi:hypothetical protein
VKEVSALFACSQQTGKLLATLAGIKRLISTLCSCSHLHSSNPTTTSPVEQKDLLLTQQLCEQASRLTHHVVVSISNPGYSRSSPKSILDLDYKLPSNQSPANHRQSHDAHRLRSIDACRVRHGIREGQQQATRLRAALLSAIAMARVRLRVWADAVVALAFSTRRRTALVSTARVSTARVLAAMPRRTGLDRHALTGGNWQYESAGGNGKRGRGLMGGLIILVRVSSCFGCGCGRRENWWRRRRSEGRAG